MGTFFPVELMRDTARVLFGYTEFSWGVWLLVSIILLASSLTLTVLTRTTVLNIATETTTRQLRTVVWMPISVLGISAIFATFVVTVIGIPIAILVALATPLVLLYGYAALSLVLGHRLASTMGSPLNDMVAIALGVLVLRTIRVIPVVGGGIHGLIMWFGFAAASMVAVDMAVSWYRRRMPDDEQFPGRQPIEWDEVVGNDDDDDSVEPSDPNEPPAGPQPQR